jgi:electron transfer flavoprotein beta subunit
MDAIVFLRMVPDVVEELVIAADGRSLDAPSIRMKLNEPDEHALEQAVLLKERHGGKVMAVAPEAPELDEVLFTALAKGVDRAVKLQGDFTGMHAPALARVFAGFLSSTDQRLTSDTVLLLGSQAIDDLEGDVASYLAAILGLPYLGVLTGFRLDEATKKKMTLIKEFAGGLRGEFEVPLPAVLGVQSAEKPPRYVPIAKVRAAMKSARIEGLEIPPVEEVPGVLIEKMFPPEVAERAEMLEGSPQEVSARLLELLSQRGLIGR